MRVLIAEDDVGITKVLEAAFKRVGHEPFEATTAEDAVRLAAEEVPDVVLIDGLLPKGGGLSVIQRLNLDARTRDLPLILLTGRALPTYLSEGLKAGAVTYVLKPFDPDELTSLLDDVVGMTRTERAELRAKALANLKVQQDEDSQAQLAAIVESSDDAIIGKTVEGIVVSWNRGAQKLYGYSPSEIIGRPIGMLVPGDRPDEVPEILARIRNGEVVDHFETLRQRKDGSLVQVSLTISPVRNRAGEIIGASTIARDVSGRHEAEEAVSRLAAIVDSADEAILGKTLSGQVTSWNAGAEALYGYSADEAIGRQISFLVPPDRSDEVPEILQSIRNGERVRHLKTQRLRKDGSLVDVMLSVSPVRGADGRVIGASTIARNITKELEAERKIREATELKDTVLHMVAHDLRSPLATINGFATLLRNRPDEYNEAERQSFLESILGAGKTILTMVEELLQASELESGNLVLEARAFDMSEVIERSIAESGLPAARIDVDIPGDLPRALGDPARTLRIQTNLLSNALKYTPADSPVHIRVRSHEGGIEVCVRDEGPGIPPDRLARMFQKFSKLADRDSGSKSFGLGLYISRMLAESQGGRIWVESELGSGASFFYTVPTTK